MKVSDSTDELQQAIEDTMSMISDIAMMEYEGIAGSLLNWVPEPFRNEFVRRRSNLLSEYSLDELRDYLKAYTDARFNSVGSCRTGFRTASYYPIDIEDDLDFLCHLRHCVKLGVIEGLKLLAGTAAVTGQKIINGGKDGHVIAHGSLEEKHARYEWFRTTFIRVHEEHPMWNLTAVRAETAKRCNVCSKTIQTHVKIKW